MKYEFLDGPLSPSITHVFRRYLIENQMQARLVTVVHDGVEAQLERSEGGDGKEILQASAEMIFSRACDNFQTYISEILYLIYNKHPHSFFKRKYDAALAFSATNLEDLKRSIIDEQVGDLSYKSLHELAEFVQKSTGFQLFPNNISLLRASSLMNVRNLITHNRGIINSLYFSRTRKKNVRIGEKVEVPDALKAQRYLTTLAKDIDSRACLKFDFDREDLLFRVKNND